MSKRWWQAGILILMLIFGGIPTHAQRPDPHGTGTGRPAGTAVASPESVGCDLVVPYTRALYAHIEDSGAFATFFTSSPDFGDITAREADDIIRDGDVLVEDLQGLDPPSIYAAAHQGIIALMQFEIDTARFFGIDTSVVPDIAGQEKAFTEIEAGERALAEACPAEVGRVGGFILLDPAEAPAPSGEPGNPPG